MRARSVLRLHLAFAVLALVTAGAAPGAQAFDFFDERVQVHGFYETQIRGMARDFDGSDNWDLTQFAHSLNIEIEWDAAPEGFGPFDLVSLFARVEVRYDCVYSRACGLFPSANTYGDRPKRLPKRMGDARGSGFDGTQFTGDTSKVLGQERAKGFVDRNVPEGGRNAAPLFNTGLASQFFGIGGVDGMLGTVDDPAPFYFSRYLGDHCRFGARRTKGPEDGVGSSTLGPLDPACKVRPLGAMANKPHPFRAGDVAPPVVPLGGFGALPYRPAPDHAFDSNVPIERGEAKGNWIPNYGLRKMLRDGELTTTGFNFRVEELAWNRGQSQSTWKELKELYFDIEMFDSQLWLRIGRQNIVWGKTELFAIDPFNPQDLALASLPTLEESRIPLWAIRGVWSFYQVGPFDDVRLEVAMNYDRIQISDFGRCGEPYTVLVACGATFGLMAHGLTGLGLAGLAEPPAPWNSWKGIEIGARLEWRYDRFSFAITDYYGYTDLPYVDQIFRYSRNVDPETGRPRHTTTEGSCRTGKESSCLRSEDALILHHGNQQLVGFICATSVGATTLDLGSCAQTIFNSQVVPAGSPIAIATVLTTMLAGDSTGPFGSVGQIFGGLSGLPATFPNPLVSLNADPMDPRTLGNINPSGVPLFGAFAIEPFTTPEQQALLGCGPFYETSCDAIGIDVFNTEYSAIAQSWSVFEGTFGTDWDTFDDSVAQPGTWGFDGGPVCTRYADGKIVMLPGCRGPGDAGYDPRIDGSPPNPGSSPFPGVIFTNDHPFTGQSWRSEMAAISWNFQMVLVGFSMPDDPANPEEDEFDATDPLRMDGCSFRKPQLCFALKGFIDLSGVQRNTLNAAGNGRFGRRDWVWHMGSPLVARLEKRNILGFGLDFAEDTLKTNWSFEFNWEEGLKFGDTDEVDGLSEVDTYNLTVSVDRPTFINFLNSGRTFFFNSQWFFQYIRNYRRTFGGQGPWNVLATFTVTTGYFQDRLLPSFTLVYDMRSNSGAFLPSLTYRFTESFSATLGVAGFWGRQVARPTGLTQVGPANRVGRHAYKDFGEPGLSVVRERDEVFLRVKYTF